MNWCTLAGEEQAQTADSSLCLTFWQWYLWKTRTCDHGWICASYVKTQLEMPLSGHINLSLLFKQTEFEPEKKEWNNILKLFNIYVVDPNIIFSHFCLCEQHYRCRSIVCVLTKDFAPCLQRSEIFNELIKLPLMQKVKLINSFDLWCPVCYSEWVWIFPPHPLLNGSSVWTIIHLWFSIIPHYQSQKGIRQWVGVAYAAY